MYKQKYEMCSNIRKLYLSVRYHCIKKPLVEFYADDWLFAVSACLITRTRPQCQNLFSWYTN